MEESVPSQDVVIRGEGLRTEELVRLARSPETTVRLDDEARLRMQKSRDYIESRLRKGEVMYGVNTGFGAFSSVRISDTEIEQLQRNLIRSHSVGVGEPFSLEQTRAMMALRANALARGHSGIRPEVVDKILEFLNKNVIPFIPSQGSVGASGDLAPLSHLALSLIGEGKVWGGDGSPIETAVLLEKKQIKPIELKAKEGLSLINGCQVMTAVGLLGLWQAQRLLKIADIAGAMSLEALKGSRRAFDPLISATRPHRGEALTAANLRALLRDSSAIGDSHVSCNKVQDAYSLRCMPAVHGAVKDAVAYAIRVLETEANSSTDNPLVFAEENKVLSCGNFHGMPVAHALDFAAVAMTSLASISEARISKLINPAMSELPAFLAANGGLHSGHMIVQVAAASLVSENKVLAHPASVDTIPTSADKEDHVSMGTIAARKFVSIVQNTEKVLAMELLCAAQGLGFHEPLRPSEPLQAVLGEIRKFVPFAKEDRVFHNDIAAILQLIEKNAIVDAAEQLTGELQCQE
ncbi:MAG: histidine ammonia-lyase [Bdellovibrionaceae bacterium]|nr:histidine ammonia-lyase [Pseudobdellovibrionaceae bacterium]